MTTASLTEQLQQKCTDWGAYWRASDAHGVVLSREQALELLRDALGVEVEFKSEATAKHYREAGQTLMATEPPSCAYDCAEAVAGGPRCERGICVNPA